MVLVVPGAIVPRRFLLEYSTDLCRSRVTTPAPPSLAVRVLLPRLRNSTYVALLLAVRVLFIALPPALALRDVPRPLMPRSWSRV